jgi:hypothetical protein
MLVIFDTIFDVHLSFFLPGQLGLGTHGQKDGQRVKYTRYAWAGGTFFPVVLLCQFSVLAGNRFWFYILLMYLEYHTGVVLCKFFWFWREIVFGTYVLSVQYSCAIVSSFLLWWES